MKILKRYKNTKGVVVEYEVLSSNGETSIITADTASMYKDSITNAKLMSNGDFKASRGSHIETVVKDYAKEYRRQRQQEHEQAVANGLRNCYGKDYVGICKRCREYVKDKNMQVQMTDNTHIRLFWDLLKQCGLYAGVFARDIIANIQPYQLSVHQKAKSNLESDTFIYNIGFGVGLIFKEVKKGSVMKLVVAYQPIKRVSPRLPDVENFCALLYKGYDCAVGEGAGCRVPIGVDVRTVYFETGKLNIKAGLFFTSYADVLNYVVFPCVKDYFDMVEKFFKKYGNRYSRGVDSDLVPENCSNANELVYQLRFLIKAYEVCPSSERSKIVTIAMSLANYMAGVTSYNEVRQELIEYADAYSSNLLYRVLVG